MCGSLYDSIVIEILFFPHAPYMDQEPLMHSNCNFVFRMAQDCIAAPLYDIFLKSALKWYNKVMIKVFMDPLEVEDFIAS